MNRIDRLDNRPRIDNHNHLLTDARFPWFGMTLISISVFGLFLMALDQVIRLIRLDGRGANEALWRYNKGL